MKIKYIYIYIYRYIIVYGLYMMFCNQDKIGQMNQNSKC